MASRSAQSEKGYNASASAKPKSFCDSFRVAALKCLTDGQTAQIVDRKPFSKEQCKPFFEDFKKCRSKVALDPYV
eukprot:48534-Amorphochlora_amoeboformis.AAC.2